MCYMQRIYLLYSWLYGGCVDTAGEAYSSRPPIHTLGFSRVCVLSCVWHLFTVLLCLWTNNFTLRRTDDYFRSCTRKGIHVDILNSGLLRIISFGFGKLNSWCYKSWGISPERSAAVINCLCNSWTTRKHSPV